MTLRTRDLASQAPTLPPDDLQRTRSWCLAPLTMLRCSYLVFVLLAAGCTTKYLAWRRLDQPTALKPDDLVWIWRRGVATKWHAVSITQDSVSGVPYELPLLCDSCRHTLPRSQVDSMQVGYFHHNVAREALEDLGIVSLVILVEAGVCALIHARNDC